MLNPSRVDLSQSLPAYNESEALRNYHQSAASLRRCSHPSRPRPIVNAIDGTYFFGSNFARAPENGDSELGSY